MYPKIALVESGGDESRFIVQATEETGYLVDLDQDTKSEVMNLQTLIKGGYWEDYTGDLDSEDLDLELEA